MRPSTSGRRRRRQGRGSGQAQAKAEAAAEAATDEASPEARPGSPCAAPGGARVVVRHTFVEVQGAAADEDHPCASAGGIGGRARRAMSEPSRSPASSLPTAHEGRLLYLWQNAKEGAALPASPSAAFGAGSTWASASAIPMEALGPDLTPEKGATPAGGQAAVAARAPWPAAAWRGGGAAQGQALARPAPARRDEKVAEAEPAGHCPMYPLPCYAHLSDQGPWVVAGHHRTLSGRSVEYPLFATPPGPSDAAARQPAPMTAPQLPQRLPRHPSEQRLPQQQQQQVVGVASSLQGDAPAEVRQPPPPLQQLQQPHPHLQQHQQRLQLHLQQQQLQPQPDFPAADGDRTRTSVMLRNLPNNYTRAMVLKMLDDEGFHGTYNFVYFPIDFRSRAGLGYAFVNFEDPQTIPRFWRTFEGFSNWMLPSKKCCFVSWCAPHQGLDAHVERYRNSPVMHESVPDDFKPLVFDAGMRIPFPPATKVIRAPRLRTQADVLAAAPAGSRPEQQPPAPPTSREPGAPWAEAWRQA